jgi:hypothetical protein
MVLILANSIPGGLSNFFIKFSCCGVGDFNCLSKIFCPTWCQSVKARKWSDYRDGLIKIDWGKEKTSEERIGGKKYIYDSSSTKKACDRFPIQAIIGKGASIMKLFDQVYFKNIQKNNQPNSKPNY